MKNHLPKIYLLKFLIFVSSGLTAQDSEFPKKVTETIEKYTTGLSVQLLDNIKDKKRQKAAERFNKCTPDLNLVFNDLDSKNFKPNQAYELIHENKETYRSNLLVQHSKYKNLRLSYSLDKSKFCIPNEVEIGKIMEYDKKLKKPNINERRKPNNNLPEFVLIMHRKFFTGSKTLLPFPNIQEEILILQVTKTGGNDYGVVGAINKHFFDSQVLETSKLKFEAIPDKAAEKIDKKNQKLTGPTPTLNDRDRDGISDDLDVCPENYGPIEMNGCPDSDSDGIKDEEDDCPTVPGGKTGVKGCPDSDSDGVIDEKDNCPSEHGGKTGVQGCPDKDEDGLLDKDDKCPDLPRKLIPERGEDENYLKGCPPSSEKIEPQKTDKTGESIFAVLRDKFELKPGKRQIESLSIEELSKIFSTDSRIHYINCLSEGTPSGSYPVSGYFEGLKNKGYVEIELRFEFESEKYLNNGDIEIYFMQYFKGFGPNGVIKYADRTRKKVVVSKAVLSSGAHTQAFGSIEVAECIK
jgi:hypothetical protein